MRVRDSISRDLFWLDWSVNFDSLVNAAGAKPTGAGATTGGNGGIATIGGDGGVGNTGIPHAYRPALAGPWEGKCGAACCCCIEAGTPKPNPVAGRLDCRWAVGLKPNTESGGVDSLGAGIIGPEPNLGKGAAACWLKLTEADEPKLNPSAGGASDKGAAERERLPQAFRSSDWRSLPAGPNPPVAGADLWATGSGPNPSVAGADLRGRGSGPNLPEAGADLWAVGSGPNPHVAGADLRARGSRPNPPVAGADLRARGSGPNPPVAGADLRARGSGPNPPVAGADLRARGSGPNPPVAGADLRAKGSGPNPPVAGADLRARGSGPNPPVAGADLRARGSGPNPPVAGADLRARMPGPNPPVAGTDLRARMSGPNPPVTGADLRAREQVNLVADPTKPDSAGVVLKAAALLVELSELVGASATDSSEATPNKSWVGTDAEALVVRDLSAGVESNLRELICLRPPLEPICANFCPRPPLGATGLAEEVTAISLAVEVTAILPASSDIKAGNCCVAWCFPFDVWWKDTAHCSNDSACFSSTSSFSLLEAENNDSGSARWNLTRAHLSLIISYPATSSFCLDLRERFDTTS